MSRKLRPDRVALLISRFPAALSITNRRPLMLGVYEQIVAAGIDMPGNHVKQSLREYCGHQCYQAALVEGASRIDLTGNSAGVVTADEAAHAVQRRENRIARHQERAADRRAAKSKISASMMAPIMPPVVNKAAPISTKSSISTFEIVPVMSSTGSVPGRIGLAELKAAAARRRAMTGSP